MTDGSLPTCEDREGTAHAAPSDGRRQANRRTGRRAEPSEV